MAMAFVSQGDLGEKETSSTGIVEGFCVFTAEGDPNSSVIIGDDGMMTIEAPAPPPLAQEVIDGAWQITDKRITHGVLTRYHAIRVLGAIAFKAEQIIMSDNARVMVVERDLDMWAGHQS